MVMSLIAMVIRGTLTAREGLGMLATVAAWERDNGTAEDHVAAMADVYRWTRYFNL
jgi:hypothetical protein